MARHSPDQIVAAAWKVVDRDGLSAFTIRAVAKELSISPMATYHYVASKTELATLMVEAAYQAQPVATPTGEWQEDLWRLSCWVRDANKTHPALSMVHRQYRVWTPALLQIADRWVALWHQSGLDGDSALVAARTSSQAIMGMVDEEMLYADQERPSEELLADVPATRIMFEPDRPDDPFFELAVRSIIEGLYARLSLNPFKQAHRNVGP